MAVSIKMHAKEFIYELNTLSLLKEFAMKVLTGVKCLVLVKSNVVYCCPECWLLSQVYAVFPVLRWKNS